MSDSKTQLAVALHYDHAGAPRVVAKGRGSIGEKIIEVAKAHDIPIEENEVLAGALCNVEIGDEIGRHCVLPPAQCGISGLTCYVPSTMKARPREFARRIGKVA